MSIMSERIWKLNAEIVVQPSPLLPIMSLINQEQHNHNNHIKFAKGCDQVAHRTQQQWQPTFPKGYKNDDQKTLHACHGMSIPNHLLCFTYKSIDIFHIRILPRMIGNNLRKLVVDNSYGCKRMKLKSSIWTRIYMKFES